MVVVYNMHQKLQNDLELLNLLYNYYNLPENKIEDKNRNFQKWFEERMNIRDILMEQNLIQDYILNIKYYHDFKPLQGFS